MSTDTSKKEKKENNQWVQYVQFFREMNPELDHKQALKEAKESYQMLKKVYIKNGSFSNIDLLNPQIKDETKKNTETNEINNNNEINNTNEINNNESSLNKNIEEKEKIVE